MGVPVFYAGSHYKPGVLVPIPTPPVPVPPSFVSAEVGDVDATTVAVTFDRAVLAAENDYLLGVTIKVNGSAATLISGIRQTNHAIIYYALTPAVISTDTVTWEYSAASGIIVSETDGDPLANVAAQSVTNNVPGGIVPLIDLEADTLVLSDGDPVSTWADQSGNGNDFTQTGAARPAFVANIGGYPAVYFDSTIATKYLIGPNVADNLSSFSVVVVGEYDQVVGLNTNVISKMSDFNTGSGWIVDLGQGATTTTGDVFLQQDGSNYIGKQSSLATLDFVVLVASNLSGTVHIYINGDNTGESDASSGTVTTFSTSDPIRLGTDGGNTTGDNAFSGWVRAVRIYAPGLDDTQRATVEAELATRYGITL